MTLGKKVQNKKNEKTIAQKIKKRDSFQSASLQDLWCQPLMGWSFETHDSWKHVSHGSKENADN